MADLSLAWLEEQFRSRDRTADFQATLNTYGRNMLLGLGRYAELIVTPDLPAQGLLPRLLDWVKKCGAEVTSVVSLLLDPSEITALYAGRTTHHRSRRRANSFWLSPRLYGMDAVLLVILRALDPKEQDLQAVVRESKGKSPYLEHGPESFRGVSPIADSCFSLLHTADDYEGFLHEGELLIGREGFLLALDPARTRVEEPEVLALVSHPSLPLDNHPFELVYRLLERGLAQLVGDPRTPVPPETIRETAGELRKRRAEAAKLGRATAQEAWAPLRDLVPALNDLSNSFYGILRGVGGLPLDRYRNARAELCQALACLCHAATLTARTTFPIVEVFRRNGIPLNNWEEHRLLVLGIFHGNEV